MPKRTFARTGAGLCLGVFALVGCGHTITGADGSKVTFDPGGQIQTTDAKGNTATVTSNGQNLTVQSKDGTSQFSSNNSGTMTSHDDKGNSLEIGTGVSEAELGVPFYPGSTETKNSMKTTTDKETEFISVRLTPDDPSKVVAFYTDKLGKPASSISSDAMTMANWKSGKKSEVLMLGKQGASNQISLTVVNEK